MRMKDLEEENNLNTGTSRLGDFRVNSRIADFCGLANSRRWDMTDILADSKRFKKEVQSPSEFSNTISRKNQIEKVMVDSARLQLSKTDSSKKKWTSSC
ncbi:uncharacterized protein J3R85_009424 [Psidium guajava]|nr:uncharacterized protein J3R85_009424 [Psidium guajava]